MSRRTAPSEPVVWRAVSASVKGSSHDQSGLSNQDAVAVRSPETSPGSIVAAVADGHGGARYVRSAVGSALAVEIACSAASELLVDLGGAGPSPLDSAGVDRLTRTILGRWRDQVRAHRSSAPFTAEETARGGVDLDVDPLVAYGCTLILTLLTPSWVGIVQVGDGDAFLVGVDGSVTSPVPGDDRLVGGETTSLCLPDAQRDVRWTVVAGEQPELVVLASDGYGNSFASSAWREEAGPGFLAAARQSDLDDVATKLPGWLADSAQAGGDDVSMVVAQRSGPRATTGSPAAAAAGGSAPSRHRGLVGALAALVVGVLIGGAGGWLLASDDDQAPADTTATTVALTAPPTVTVAVLTVDPVSILLPGRVITFVPVLTAGEVEPVVTLEDESIEPVDVEGPLSARVEDGGVVITEEGATPERPEVGREVVAVRVVDDIVWVASENGGLRALDAAGSPLIPWQDLATDVAE